MQWLIDLIIETIGIPPVFIDRGDPAAHDFLLTDLINDAAWHELDLSTIVPAGASAVALYCSITNGTVGRKFRFRKHGNTNERNISDLIAQISGVEIAADLVVPLDSNRKIDYKVNLLGFPIAHLTVKGWWL